MNNYQILSIVSIATLVLMVSLTTYILVGKHTIKKVYTLAGIGLFLMILLTISCSIIYRHYV
jgi:hypothetical protein